MISIKASSALSLIASLAPEPSAKSPNGFRFIHRQACPRGIKITANMQVPVRTNGTIVRENDFEDIRFDEEQMARFGSGTFLPNSHIHRQYFPIRSYEIGPNGTVTLETLMSLLQESGINCVKGVGIEVDGLALTPEMLKRNIIWVMTKIQVEIDRYPTSGDFLEVDNWSAMIKKIGIRRDSLIRDYKTGHTLLRASSYWLFMNQETKKVTRIPDDLREISAPYLMDSDPIIKDDDNVEFPKRDETTVDFICGGLKPRWSDLDGNQHVNNAKYIGWIFETVPRPILENYELCRITMEYKRECHLDSVVQSKTSASSTSYVGLAHIECSHLLTLESGPEIMKAQTSWRPKFSHTLENSL